MDFWWWSLPLRSIFFASPPYQITRAFQNDVASENLVRIFPELLCLRVLGHIFKVGDVSLADEGVDACRSQKGPGRAEATQAGFSYGLSVEVLYVVCSLGVECGGCAAELR